MGAAVIWSALALQGSIRPHSAVPGEIKSEVQGLLSHHHEAEDSNSCMLKTVYIYYLFYFIFGRHGLSLCSLS